MILNDHVCIECDTHQQPQSSQCWCYSQLKMNWFGTQKASDVAFQGKRWHALHHKIGPYCHVVLSSNSLISLSNCGLHLSTYVWDWIGCWNMPGAQSPFLIVQVGSKPACLETVSRPLSSTGASPTKMAVTLDSVGPQFELMPASCQQTVVKIYLMEAQKWDMENHWPACNDNLFVVDFEHLWTEY